MNSIFGQRISKAIHMEWKYGSRPTVAAMLITIAASVLQGIAGITVIIINFI